MFAWTAWTALMAMGPLGPSGTSAERFGQTAWLRFPAAARADALRRVVVAGTGDVLLHTRVVESARERNDFRRLFAGLADIVRPEEIAFANLETPLSEGRLPMRGDPPRLGAPRSVATALSSAGFDIVSLANNHAWDQRDVGLRDTMEALSSAGIVAVGAHPERARAPGPVLVERDGVRVAFLAFTVNIQGYAGRRRPLVRVSVWDEVAARRALRRARREADVVVVSMHWGLAYRHDHRFEQRTLARWLVRRGADVVLGHGPHVLQPVERVRSRRGQALIAYSLGNLISNQGYLFHPRRRVRAERALRTPATRDGVWLRVTVEVPGPGQVRVASVSAVPLWTHNNYWDEARRRADKPDIRVIPLHALPDDRLVQKRRRRIAEALGPAVRLLER